MSAVTESKKDVIQNALTFITVRATPPFAAFSYFNVFRLENLLPDGSC